MRLKKIKGAEEYLNNSEYVIKDLTNIPTDMPLYLEIGCGKGDFIIKNAIINPNIMYIAVEKYASVLFKAVKKAEEMQLDNLRFICMDASNIKDVFENRVDLLFLNFSDPWHKKAHHKRRLTSHVFLKEYDYIFRGDNIIFQKTDNKALFEYSIESLSTYGYTLKNISVDLHSNKEIENVVSEYEAKFAPLGPIYRLEAYKNNN